MLTCKLTEIREILDSLYDTIEDPTSTQSMLYLKADELISEAKAESSKNCDYIEGSEIDWDDLNQVNELLGIKVNHRNEGRIY